MRRVLLALIALAQAAPASAAVRVQSLDVSSYPTVRATVVTSTPARTRPVVFDGGRRALLLEAHNLAAAKSVVIAIDRSQSMSGASLHDAIAAARRFVSRKLPADRVAVVAFGADAEQLSAFSVDREQPAAALRSVTIDRRSGTALYDGLVFSANALRSEADAGRVIVLLTDGRDVSSHASLSAAIAAARAAGAVAYPIAVGADADTRALRRIAVATGGRYRSASTTGALDRLYAAIADELRRTWLLEWATTARPGERARIRVRFGGAGTAAAVLAPPGETGTRRVGIPAGAWWADVTVALAVGLFVLLAVNFVRAYRRAAALRRRVHVPAHAPRRETETRAGLVGRLRSRAAGLFAATEGALGERRQWRSLERVLERADVPLRPVELLYSMLGGALLFALVGALAGVAPLVLVLLFAAGAGTPYWVVALKARRRASAFDAQLPDLLMTLASSLKAGHGFRQGLQSLVDEGRDPARREFQRVLSEARLGRPLESALADMTQRLGSENFTFVVSAVTIQRQVGGSLAGILDMVAETVRERQQFGRKIKALTAQGRMSAYVLVAMPVFLGLALTLINASYMAPLIHTSAGHLLLIVGSVLMCIGALILRKIVAFAG